jgi:hypothetical protein
MINFLFWNIHKNDLSELISILLRDKDIDIAVFAEAPLHWEANLLTTINTDISRQYKLALTLTPKFTIITRFEREWIQIVSDPNGHYTLKRLITPDGEDLLLVIVHLVSQMNMSRDECSVLLPRQ